VNAPLGTLKGDLFLETAAFIRDMRKAGDAVATNTFKMRQSMRQVEKATSGVRRTFSQLRAGAVALAGALAARQFVSFAKTSLDFADALAKSADSVGMTTSEFQQFQVAAGLSGISAEKFGVATQFFVKTLGEARAGTGKMVTSLKTIDKGFLSQITSAKTTGEALGIYLKRMGETKGAADRAMLATTGFGRAGVAMVNMLSEGGKGLEDMKAQALALGLVLEDNLIRHAEAVNDRMELLKRSFDIGFARGIIVEFANSFQLTADNVNAARTAGENFGKVVGVALKGLAAAAVMIGTHIREITAALGALIALKAASMFITTGIAVIKFGQALVAAARAGALVDTIMSKSILGTIAKLAIALGTATVIYNQFGGQITDATKQLADLERGITSNGAAVSATSAKIAESIAEKKREIENWGLLKGKLSEGERSYQNAKAAIDITTESIRLEIDANSALGQSWLQAALGAYEAQRAHDDLKKAVDEAAAVGKDVGNAIGSSFENAILEGQKLRDVVKGLLSDFARLAIRKLATEPLSNSLGGLFGAIRAGIGHVGMIAGNPPVRRSVDSSVFANAPRMHSGGIAGLKSDEVPAILRQGEPVFQSMDHARKVVGGGDTYIDNSVRTFNNATPEMRAWIEARLKQDRHVNTAEALKAMKKRRASDPQTYGGA
jgi:hypothetical protein